MAFQFTSRAMRMVPSSFVMLTSWWIWKHHNAPIFDNALPNMSSLLDTIRSEARSWVAAGTIGLRALIPATAQIQWVELYGVVLARPELVHL